MQLGNPLPVFLGIPLMACFCWLIARWVPVLDSNPAHGKTIALDGLRGILASAVLFHHAFITYVYFRTGVWATPASNFYAQLGPTAVLMFFFISGYLFWRKMLKDPVSITPSRLLPNRARRILPAYIVAIAIFFLIAAWHTHFQRLVPASVLGLQIVSTLLGGFPLSSEAMRGVGDSFNTLQPILMTGGIFWTLQEEWLFYFLLPFLKWFRPVLKLLLLPILFLIAQQLLEKVHVSTPAELFVRMFVERFSRMFVCGFAIGMLAAYDIPSRRIHAVLRSPWMTPIAAILLAFHLFLISQGARAFDPPQEAALLIPIFFMIIAGNDFCGLLSSSPMRCLGTVSYSLYIFHGMILHLCTLMIDRYDPIRLMTPLHYWLWVLPISLVVVLWSTLSYQFIERPFFARRKAVP